MEPIQEEQLVKAACSIIEKAMAELNELEKSEDDDANGGQNEVVGLMPSEQKPEEDKDEDQKDEPKGEPAEKSEEPAAEEDSVEDDEEEKKDEEKKPEEAMDKSEAAPVATPAPVVAEAAPAPSVDKTDELRKSFDGRFESLAKAIENLTARVEQIASAKAPRKGVTGLAPLRKSEEESDEPKPLRKSEVLDTLLKAQAEGNKNVTPLLISKIEVGSQLSNKEFETIKSLTQ